MLVTLGKHFSSSTLIWEIVLRTLNINLWFVNNEAKSAREITGKQTHLFKWRILFTEVTLPQICYHWLYWLARVQLTEINHLCYPKKWKITVVADREKTDLAGFGTFCELIIVIIWQWKIQLEHNRFYFIQVPRRIRQPKWIKIKEKCKRNNSLEKVKCQIIVLIKRNSESVLNMKSIWSRKQQRQFLYHCLKKKCR